MSIPASLTTSRLDERREHNARRKLRLFSNVERQGKTSRDAEVLDISATGLLLETATKLAIGERLLINLDAGGTCNATIVWSSGRLYGCRFDAPLSRGQLGAAILRGQTTPGALHSGVAAAGADGESLGPAGGDLLARMRRSRGLTQSDLASLVGVSKTTIWKWESGSARPRRATSARLEELFGSNPFGPQAVFRTANTSSVPVGNATLEDAIQSSKKRIAAAIGISPSMVSIQILL